MLQVFLFMLMSFSYAAPMGIQEQWSSISDPLIMGKHFEIRLFMLPMNGKVNEPKKFWSGDYWAMNKGSINKRWYAKTGFKSASPSKEMAQSMSMNEIAQLSPAEKYDLFIGRYWYPLKQEVAKISDYDAQSWEGICHGWAPAAMNHNEPTPKTMINPDGIAVPFGSSDIKALISYFYAFPYQVLSTHQIGRRCDRTVANPNEDCKQDLNAGAFHIILANRIGLENKGFIADFNRFQQVWNHPIQAYSSRITGEGRTHANAAPGTVRTVKMSTTITYVSESSNSWEPQNGTRNHDLKTQTYQYILEIDANGQIIGGQWKSLQRPDFLWIKEAPNKFGGNYVRLKELLND